VPSMDTLVTADPKFPLIVQSPPPIGPETVVEPLFIEFVCTGSGAGAGAAETVKVFRADVVPSLVALK